MKKLYKQENNVWVLDTAEDGKHIINYEVITQIVGTVAFEKKIITEEIIINLSDL